MSSELARNIDAAHLRRRAEQRVFEGGTAEARSLEEGDLRRLLHELQVHQVELLMQNEELQTARDEVATLLDAYTDLYDHAPVGYLTFERAGIVRQANFKAAGCLGLERARLIGSPFGRFLAEGSRATFSDFLARHFSSDTAGACELQVLPKAGAARWIELEAAGPENANECRMALVDISERREMEGQLQLAQRMESLGRLAGGVAHDINNVLAGIQGVVSSLELKPAAVVPFASELALVQRATLRGRDLVRRLLDFTRADLESPRLLDLNDFVRGELGILEHTTRRQVQFTTHLAPGLPPILGESSALSTTLMNLCVNALDAMQGRGTIQLWTRNLGDGRIELVVEDDGCGMTADVQARAAEPFFTTKPPGEGTGLGLSQAFGLMRAHGGSVEIRSEPGRGTSIALRFPVAEGGGLAVRAEAVAVPVVPPLHILVVDDDELIQATLPVLLEDLGHTVVGVAASGLEALERLAGGLSLELVMLDYNMPGLTGLETLEEMRKRGSAARVLVTTGMVEPGVEQAIRAYGNAGVLRKPFTLEEFNAAVAGLLGA